MTTVTLESKTPIGASGNNRYKFECKCDNGDLFTIVEDSGNDQQAQKLAQMECDGKCGES